MDAQTSTDVITDHIYVGALLDNHVFSKLTDLADLLTFSVMQKVQYLLQILVQINVMMLGRITPKTSFVSNMLPSKMVSFQVPTLISLRLESITTLWWLMFRD